MGNSTRHPDFFYSGREGEKNYHPRKSAREIANRPKIEMAYAALCKTQYFLVIIMISCNLRCIGRICRVYVCCTALIRSNQAEITVCSCTLFCTVVFL